MRLTSATCKVDTSNTARVGTMFKSRSFDLVADDRISPSERFYQPCRVRWMKYILIPALVGFALLLILSNVNFSYEPAKRDIRTIKRSYGSLGSSGSSGRAYAGQVRAMTFCQVNDSTNKCSVVCDQSMANLAKELDQCQRNCNDKLTVRLENCDFPNYLLSSSLFSIDKSLHSLEIADCGQYDIDDRAFNQQSFSDLISLQLINTQFHTLNANSFKGLSNVQIFKLSNAWSSFQGTGFLLPMAATLRRVDIVHFSKSGKTSVPLTWLGSGSYTQLVELQLAGNYFDKQLATDTFSKMPALVQLNLAACGLETVHWDLLSPVADTLRYLDISDNSLTTLSADFLLGATNSDLSLELHGNMWDCSCLNADLLEYSRAYENSFSQVPQCATPDSYMGKPLSSCVLDCLAKSTESVESATSSSTIDTSSPSTMIPTTISDSVAENVESATSSSTIDTSSPSTMIPTTISDSVAENGENATSSSTVDISSSATMIPTTISDSVATDSEEEWTMPAISSTKTTTTKTTSTTTQAPPTTTTTATDTETTDSEEDWNVVITSSTTESTTTINTTTPTYDAETDSTTDSGVGDAKLITKMFCLMKPSSTRATSLTSVAYDAVITVEDVSDSHVKVQLAKLQAARWQLLVFAEYTTVRQIGQETATQTTGNVLTVDVDHLHCSTAYVFCLTVADATTSPYNCRSHRTWGCLRTQSWFEHHVVLITSLGTAVLLLCLVAGLFVMYAVLRLRPTWLRGSKRLVRPTRDTNKMLLLPKENEDEKYAGIRTPNSVGNNCDYIAYYRNLEQAKLYLTESSKCSVPPKERAPSVPPSSERNSSQSTATESNTYIYECLELYEELF